MLTYDVSDPAAPVLVDHRGYDAGLVRRRPARRRGPAGDQLRPARARLRGAAVLARRGGGARDQPGGRGEVRGRRLAAHRDDVRRGGRATGPSSSLDCSQVTVPRDTAALGTVAVVGFDGRRAGAGDARSGSPPTPGSRTSRPTGSTWRPATPPPGGAASAPCRCRRWTAPGRSRRPATWAAAGSTRSRSTDDTATYVASGVVDGVIADRWSMDEHDGVLRVAVGPSQETGNFNSVVTLREDGDDLEEVGRVDGLGVGEQISRCAGSTGSRSWSPSGRSTRCTRSTSRDPERPAAAGRAEDPGLLRLPPPDLRAAADRHGPGRVRPRGCCAARRRRCSTSPT